MSRAENVQEKKVQSFLKKRAPFSVVDRGLEYAAQGGVSECSRSGTCIQGIVREKENDVFSTTLDVVSGNQITANCECCSREEMEEQWCPHAVALLWQATHLGFFDPHSGFAAEEAVVRVNTNSPARIADTLLEVSRLHEGKQDSPHFYPTVTIFVDAESDHLGVRVLFDDALQTPAIFESFQPRSSRTLDNILLESLDDEGTWEEEQQTWHVQSSASIEKILGLLAEYRHVLSTRTKKPVELSSKRLHAELHLQWQDAAAELSLLWRLPDGSIIPKNSELIGTGPYWTMVDGVVYRLSPEATRLATLFPYSSVMTLSRTQAGPLLEATLSNEVNNDFIIVQNPDEQPEAAVKTPRPHLEIELRESDSEHFVTSNQLSLEAVLDFEYPTPPAKENIVYLPNREKEQEYREQLKEIGFHFHSAKQKYFIGGDSALDLIERGRSSFSSRWQISGLQNLKNKVRFATLDLNVSVTSRKAGSKGMSEDAEMFDCHIALVQNNAHIPLSTLFKNTQSSTQNWVRLDSGAYAKVPGGSLAQLETTLGMITSSFKLSNTIKCQITAAQAMSLARLEANHFHLTIDKHLRMLAKRLHEFDGLDEIAVPRAFSGKLRSYQYEGLQWLTFLHDYELGGILADEMGLGKTIQTLALLQSLKSSRKKSRSLSKPALIVAPTSVIANWLYEAKRFTPKLKVLLLHGSQRKQNFQSIRDYDIVITSYALLRLDRYELERFEFSYLILDEAQNIKNPQAATTRAAKSIPAKRRLALTGTPTENRPLELWSIFDFLMPGYLGSIDFFRSTIERPILEGGTDVSVAKVLARKTRPFILRRAKAEVEKDLPPKNEAELHVVMTPPQAELYSQILEEVRPKVFDALEQKGVRGASISILAALLRLRQVCNHPRSIDGLENIDYYSSGKFDALCELVAEAIENGRKILLFSQFRGMLSIIRQWLETRAIEHLYLDGSTRDRQSLIDQFNNDENVRLFLISLKAGGTGLNLTAADTVIIYDPWWNPAVESQAVDRAHRIGQQKSVNVYRLVTEDSIEQKIMKMKAKKGALVEALIHENSVSPLGMSQEDIEELFAPLPSG